MLLNSCRVPRVVELEAFRLKSILVDKNIYKSSATFANVIAYLKGGL
jgi:hypothetical protein